MSRERLMRTGARICGYLFQVTMLSGIASVAIGLAFAYGTLVAIGNVLMAASLIPSALFLVLGPSTLLFELYSSRRVNLPRSSLG